MKKGGRPGGRKKECRLFQKKRSHLNHGRKGKKKKKKGLFPDKRTFFRKLEEKASEGSSRKHWLNASRDGKKPSLR